MSNLFWFGSKSAAAVSLTEQHKPLSCILNSSPHPPDLRLPLKDLGPFVRSFQAVGDWESTTTHDVAYSPSMNAFSLKISPNQTFPATRSLYVVDDISILTSCCEIPQILLLFLQTYQKLCGRRTNTMWASSETMTQYKNHSHSTFVIVRKLRRATVVKIDGLKIIKIIECTAKN